MKKGSNALRANRSYISDIKMECSGFSTRQKEQWWRWIYGSDSLMIHEAQGLKYDTVENHQLYRSVPHAVVAITRYTGCCAYCTDRKEVDAISKLIQRTQTIRDNLKMAVRSQYLEIVNSMLALLDRERERCNLQSWLQGDECGWINKYILIMECRFKNWFCLFFNKLKFSDNSYLLI